MKIHKVRACNFEEFIKIPNLITHIIVGLAEMNANCKMFGGKNSDSYKIKMKNYEKFVSRSLSFIVNIN